MKLLEETEVKSRAHVTSLASNPHYFLNVKKTRSYMLDMQLVKLSRTMASVCIC